MGGKPVNCAADGRLCAACMQYRPWDDIINAKRNANGKGPYCKACFNARAKKLRDRPERAPLIAVARRKQIYNLDAEQEKLFLAHAGGEMPCDACGKPFAEGELPFVDHDHNCCPGRKSCGGCVRGYIHSACNTILAFAKDSPGILESLAEYAYDFSFRGVALSLYFKAYGRRCVSCSKIVDPTEAKLEMPEGMDEVVLLHRGCK